MVSAVLLLPSIAAGGGRAENGDPLTSAEETTAAPSLTVSAATEENNRIVALIVGDGRPDFQDVAQIGCRTNPDSLMSEGPPWHVRTTWSHDDPTPDFVTAALRRAQSLQDDGFRAVPWTRPEPEPPSHRAYTDDRGYSITVSSGSLPSGQQAFELYVVSPCARP